MQGWLDALPAERSAQPALRLLAGALAHGAGRLDEAVELCREASAAFDADGAPALMRFAARFALVDALMAIGDLEGAARLGDTLDDPDAPGQLAACAVAAAAAAGLARQGRFDDGRALLARALADDAAAPLRPGGGHVRRLLLRPAGRAARRRAEHTRATASRSSSAATRSVVSPTRCSS